jgi:hypothetical protein
MSNPTSPRVCQLPKGARAAWGSGARLAGLTKLFVSDLIFGESVLTAVLHRSQHRPGSLKQAQTWPDGSTNSIVQLTPVFAENRTNIFWFMVCQKWRPKPILPLIIY